MTTFSLENIFAKLNKFKITFVAHVDYVFYSLTALIYYFCRFII